MGEQLIFRRFEYFRASEEMCCGFDCKREGTHLTTRGRFEMISAL